MDLCRIRPLHDIYTMKKSAIMKLLGGKETRDIANKTKDCMSTKILRHQK